LKPELQHLSELQAEICCLQELAKGIDIECDSLVFEENVPLFEIINENKLQADIIDDFLDEKEIEEITFNEVVPDNKHNSLNVDTISND